MKRTSAIAAFTAAALALSLAACGSADSTADTAAESTAASTRLSPRRLLRGCLPSTGDFDPVQDVISREGLRPPRRFH